MINVPKEVEKRQIHTPGQLEQLLHINNGELTNVIVFYKTISISEIATVLSLPNTKRFLIKHENGEISDSFHINSYGKSFVLYF